MKRSYQLILGIAILAITHFAEAAPVQYQLTAIATEAGPDLIFSVGSPLTATFLYDASQPISDYYSDNSTFTHAGYHDVVTNIQIKINGYAIDDSGNPIRTSVDNVDFGRGQQKYMETDYTGDTGITVGNYLYALFAFTIDHPSDDLTDVALPTTLSIDNPGDPNTLQFYIAPTTPGTSYGGVFNITSLTPVPLPTSSLLYASSVLAIYCRRKVFKNNYRA